MEVELKGKVALVTGASRGLGKSVAGELAAAGAAVLLVARDVASLKDTAAAIAARGAEPPAIHPSELMAPDAAASCIDAVIDRFGRLDILVNCAGATRRGDFFNLTDGDWTDGFALKFHGSVRMCRAAWPHLIESKGCVLNVVGVSSRTPSADFTIGGSVNAALMSFTKALAELGTLDGVRVNAVNPGYIHTERLTHRIETLMREREASRADIEQELLRGYGLRRFGQPEDVARLAAFLASAHASYIHGATLDIDGGATRGL
ncbi:SDR family oxidoreductase [Paraburkholderia sediminicola]|uniref:SDR family oxidoreductase n=1 Tax=Paraburkholderia sediminicola TaxID=458836 RepID=UPI0038BD1C2B